jgi:hypothetical protein
MQINRFERYGYDALCNFGLIRRKASSPQGGAAFVHGLGHEVLSTFSITTATQVSRLVDLLPPSPAS